MTESTEEHDPKQLASESQALEKGTKPKKDTSEAHPFRFKFYNFEFEGPLVLIASIVVSFLVGVGVIIYLIVDKQEPSVIVEYVVHKALTATAAASISTPTVTPASTGIPIPSHPPVSLMSLSYEVEGWNPRRVDLKTASHSGIPVRADETLQLLDVMASIPETISGCRIRLEVYNDEGLIGRSSDKPFNTGLAQWDVLSVVQFASGEYENAWVVQPDWENLWLAPVTDCNGEPVEGSRINIRLNPTGASWFLSPPNLDFASVVYAVNDSPPLVLDLRNTGEIALNAQAGDEITLFEIWYNSNADTKEYTVNLETYLTSDGYDRTTLKITPQNIIRRGIHKLVDFPTLNWTIPEGKDHMYMTLVRSDGAVMDRLGVLLSSEGSVGLVSSPEATLLWYSPQVEFIDFEALADLNSWRNTTVSTITRSTDQIFSGEYALAITTPGTAPTPEGKILASWDYPFQAQSMIISMYWPRKRDISILWTQVCLSSQSEAGGACVDFPVQLDQWNTLVLDLSKYRPRGYSGRPLNMINHKGLYIQGQIDGANEANLYTFYLDGIQFYPAMSKN